MKKTRVSVILISICLLSIFVMTSCGGQDQEKVDKIQTDFATLVDECNALTDLYDESMANGIDLTESANEYNNIVDYINEFGEIELDGMSNDKLDEVISTIDNMRTSIKSLKSLIETLKSTSAQVQDQENAKITTIQTDYAALVDECNVLTALYEQGMADGVDLAESAVEYDKIVDHVNEFGEIELDGMGESELDEMISTIDSIRISVQELTEAVTLAIE